MIAQTDKQRILQLEAQVADLTEEVEAWRAADGEKFRGAVTMEREASIRSRVLAFRPEGVEGSRGFGGAVTRLLIVFMDNPGRLFVNHEIYDIVVRDRGETTDEAIVKVRITYVRQVLQWCGLPRSGIETVWGKGYRLLPDAAAILKAKLEPTAQAVAA